MALMIVLAVLLAFLGWGFEESFFAGPAAASLVLIPALILRAHTLKRQLEEMNERNAQAWQGLNARLTHLEAQLTARVGDPPVAAASPKKPAPQVASGHPSSDGVPAGQEPAQFDSKAGSWPHQAATPPPRTDPAGQFPASQGSGYENPEAQSFSADAELPNTETEPAESPQWRGLHAERSGNATPRAAEPTEPLEQRLKRWVVGDNPLARAGVFVLLIGVALLLRLAAEQGKFPIEARLGCAALLGIVLVAFGYRQRSRRQTFSQLLQGGGIAALYMTVFFGYRIYELLPAPLTFGLLVGVAILSGALAVLQNALALVFIGTAGGFAAPILASSGSGDYVALFSYYLLLNLLVLGVAWFKDWRLLSVTGFIATYGVGTAWGVLQYAPENFATTEPFLIAFFCIYMSLNLLTALQRPESLRGGVSGSLTFGLPLVTIALQVSLAGERDWIVAVTALAMAAIYYGLSRLLIARSRGDTRILVDSYTALAVGLATLSVPFALDSAAMTAGTWILEAGGLYWVGIRAKRRLPRIAAFLLLGAGLVQASSEGVWGMSRAGAMDVLNPTLLCAFLFLCVVLFICRCALHAKEPATPPEILWTQLLIPPALLLWAFALFAELHAFGDGERIALWMSLCALSAALVAAFGTHQEVKGARWSAFGILPLAWLLLAASRFTPEPLWADLGAVAWPVTALSLFAVLHAQKERQEALVISGHALTALWFVTLGAIGVWDVLSVALSLSAGFTHLGLGVFMALSVVGLRSVRGLNREPFLSFAGSYRQANDLLAIAVLLIFLVQLTRPGDPAPLSFVPLLNPLELTSLGLWMLLFSYSRRMVDRAETAERWGWQRVRFGVLGALSFLGLTTMLGRGISQLAAVPYQAESLWRQDAFQVGLSILWALMGLGATTWASLRRQRGVWILGAALLGLVVVKLFVVDLAELAQFAKIASFLGVGLLLLVVGYFAPLPPARLNGSRPSTPQSQ